MVERFRIVNEQIDVFRRISSAKSPRFAIKDLDPSQLRAGMHDLSFADLPVENGIFNGADNAPGAIMRTLMNEVYFCRGP